MEAFLDLLKINQIQRVVDIRTVPRSRHNPQFDQSALPATLATVGLSYSHLPGLGGLRHAARDSQNTGWRNTSFRGYADYMQTAEFAQAVDLLADLARHECCTLMCAEAVPWRCHRSLVTDALLLRGFRVEHIVGPKSRKPHTLTTFAHVDGTHITYPGPAADVRQAP
ncbi:DUF488 domain-containing protein [Massilia glaciei]|uniref:DUF488 domain-containing protein n=1 Tax=Massilia glaciei TaxID=1524097 RepID=UPI001E5C6B43|nr:DUF488 domain-containing protein [Massilia glaciei]